MMPTRTPIRKARTATERLGPVFHRLRTERSIPASQLSEETGLSRSYLNYLERGRFREMGVEKFARLVRAMQVSADEVLAEVGFPRATPGGKPPDLEAFLRARYKLSRGDLQTALNFLEFLSRKSRQPKAEKEPRSRR